MNCVLVCSCVWLCHTNSKRERERGSTFSSFGTQWNVALRSTSCFFYTKATVCEWDSINKRLQDIKKYDFLHIFMLSMSTQWPKFSRNLFNKELICAPYANTLPYIKNSNERNLNCKLPCILSWWIRLYTVAVIKAHYQPTLLLSKVKVDPNSSLNVCMYLRLILSIIVFSTQWQ